MLARETGDKVTTLGSGVDGTVRGLGYSFTDAGLPYQQTSCSSSSLSGVVNRVQDGYNGLQQLTVQYQAVDGAVSTGSTASVQYSYNLMSGGANTPGCSTRSTPNGRQVDRPPALSVAGAGGGAVGRGTGFGLPARRGSSRPDGRPPTDADADRLISMGVALHKSIGSGLTPTLLLPRVTPPGMRRMRRSLRRY